MRYSAASASPTFGGKTRIAGISLRDSHLSRVQRCRTCFIDFDRESGAGHRSVLAPEQQQNDKKQNYLFGGPVFWFTSKQRTTRDPKSTESSPGLDDLACLSRRRVDRSSRLPMVRFVEARFQLVFVLIKMVSAASFVLAIEGFLSWLQVYRPRFSREPFCCRVELSVP
jgi:hypothetical protein